MNALAVGVAIVTLAYGVIEGIAKILIAGTRGKLGVPARYSAE